MRRQLTAIKPDRMPVAMTEHASRSERQVAAARPRVLHVIGTLALGGIETWLVHMLRHKNEFSVAHEILLTVDSVGPYEEEVRSLGIPIHRLPLAGNKRRWFGQFAALLQFDQRKVTRVRFRMPRRMVHADTP